VEQSCIITGIEKERLAAFDVKMHLEDDAEAGKQPSADRAYGIGAASEEVEWYPSCCCCCGIEYLRTATTAAPSMVAVTIPTQPPSPSIPSCRPLPHQRPTSEVQIVHRLATKGRRAKWEMRRLEKLLYQGESIAERHQIQSHSPQWRVTALVRHTHGSVRLVALHAWIIYNINHCKNPTDGIIVTTLEYLGTITKSREGYL
jgi:hypothetical protein